MPPKAWMCTLILLCWQQYGNCQEQAENISSIAREGVELVRMGDWKRGLLLLRKADHAVLSRYANERGDLQSTLSEEHLAFGCDQVRKMLADRPNMAKGMDEDNVVFQWAARRFAGENLPNKMFWSSLQPVGWGALHFPPTPNVPGEVQIALEVRNYGDVRSLGFEELWSRAVFELNNALSAPQFLDLHVRTVEGRVSRDDYVREMFRLEFDATRLTRRYYLDVFAGELQSRGLDSDPILWFFSDAYMGTWEHGLQHFKDRKSYPWSSYGAYYDRCAPWPGGAKNEQHTDEFSDRSVQQ